MNLKIEALKACIFILIGAFLCNKYAPKPAPEVIVKQEQNSKCKAVITKRQNADGSIDEVTEFLSENSQKSELKVEQAKSKKNSLFYYDKELAYSRKIFETKVIDFEGAIKLEKDQTKLGIGISW